MTDHEHEKERLVWELRQAKDREKANANSTRLALFMAIWWLPLIGMGLVESQPTPAVGPMSVFGVWFLLVPIGFWIYCRMNKADNE